MKKSIILLCVMLVLAALIIVASVLYDNMLTKKDAANTTDESVMPIISVPEKEEEEEEETILPAPSFTIYDPEGNAVDSATFAGKPMVLTFWSSWSEASKEQMPLFQAQQEQLGEDVQILMVNMTTGQETLETATAFLEGVEYTFPVYFDTGSPSAAQKFGVQSLPCTYFISAQGDRIKEVHGPVDAETLQAGIDLIK